VECIEIPTESGSSGRMCGGRKLGSNPNIRAAGKMQPPKRSLPLLFTLTLFAASLAGFHRDDQRGRGDQGIEAPPQPSYSFLAPVAVQDSKQVQAHGVLIARCASSSQFNVSNWASAIQTVHPQP